MWKIPDFISEDGNTIIEVFGRVFHDPANSFIDIPYSKTYNGTMEFYEKRNKKCIIIWDDEINDTNTISIKMEELK